MFGLFDSGVGERKASESLWSRCWPVHRILPRVRNVSVSIVLRFYGYFERGQYRGFISFTFVRLYRSICYQRSFSFDKLEVSCAIVKDNFFFFSRVIVTDLVRRCVYFEVRFVSIKTISWLKWIAARRIKRKMKTFSTNCDEIQAKSKPWVVEKKKKRKKKRKRLKVFSIF